MGHAVAVAFELDVAIDVPTQQHRGCAQWTISFEAGPLPGLRGQRRQCRCIDLGKGTGAAAGPLLKRLVVLAREQPRHCVVDLFDRSKALVAQARQSSAPNLQHTQLNFGFGLRLVGASGQEASDLDF